MSDLIEKDSVLVHASCGRPVSVVVEGIYWCEPCGVSWEPPGYP